MTSRRELLVAILLYVTLDLSLSAMPGAFVFEPADSVESIGGGRPTGRPVILTTPAAGVSPIVSYLSHDLRRRLPPRSELAVLGCPLAHRRLRGTCHPSAPSDDSH